MTITFPLYFDYSFLTQGATFIANVRILGRALVEEASDTTWLFGENECTER